MPKTQAKLLLWTPERPNGYFSTAHPFPVHLVKQNEVEHNNINCNLT